MTARKAIATFLSPLFPPVPVLVPVPLLLLLVPVSTLVLVLVLVLVCVPDPELDPDAGSQAPREPFSVARLPSLLAPPPRSRMLLPLLPLLRILPPAPVISATRSINGEIGLSTVRGLLT